MAIARTAKRLGLRSEASVRFERGCDPEGVPRAIARFCELLPGANVQAGPFVVDAPRYLPTPRRVDVRTARVNAILGTELTDAQIRSYLTPIGFHTELVRDGVHEVEIPTFRPDSEREIDVIEEVARHHGYANIERTVPSSPSSGGSRRTSASGASCATSSSAPAAPRPSACLCSRRATSSGPGLDDRALVLTNPLVREESVLRTSMLPGMLRAIAFNLSHQRSDLRFFEIGNVYPRPASPEQPLPDERERLAVALAGVGGDAGGCGACGHVVAARSGSTAFASTPRPCPASTPRARRGCLAATARSSVWSARSTPTCWRPTGSRGAWDGSSAISNACSPPPGGATRRDR